MDTACKGQRITWFQGGPASDAEEVVAFESAYAEPYYVTVELPVG
jgi:hypothetical protein